MSAVSYTQYIPYWIQQFVRIALCALLGPSIPFEEKWSQQNPARQQLGVSAHAASGALDGWL